MKNRLWKIYRCIHHLLPKQELFFYIHIPKTAGSNISKRTGEHPYYKRFIAKGHPYTVRDIKTFGRKMKVFASVRNPLAWYVSLYNFKIHTDPSKMEKDYDRMENNSWHDFFDDIILGRNGLSGFERWHKPWNQKSHIQEMVSQWNRQIGFFSLNFIYYCFKDWQDILKQADIVDYVLTHYSDLISVDYILRIEQLQTDFNKMVVGYDINIQFKKDVNVCKHPPYREYYTKEMEEIVRKKDRIIFDLFHY